MGFLTEAFFGIFVEPFMAKRKRSTLDDLNEMGRSMGLPPLMSFEEMQRNQWFNQRFNSNQPHDHCCSRCFQAGYVLALLKAGRLDLMSTHPQLRTVYEELKRDGMLRT